MDQELKQRLIGASVIIALAIIFVPMMFDGDVSNPQQEKISINIPEESATNLEVKTFDLDKPVNDVASDSTMPPADVELAVVENQPQLIEVDTPTDSPVDGSDGNFTYGDPPAVADTRPESKPSEPVQNQPTNTEPEPTPEPVAAEVRPTETQPVQAQPTATKPVETPVVSPPRVVNGNQAFRVKLGSFSQQANAERVKNQLLQNNIKAVVEHNLGLKLYRVWSQQLYRSEADANQYLTQVNALKLNIGTPKVITLNANEVSQMASQGQMGWVVQLGSFSSKDNALTLRNKVKAAGFVAFVDEITNSQGAKIYRMRVGPLMEKQDAEKTKDDIQARLKLDGLVKSHELSRLVE